MNYIKKKLVISILKHLIQINVVYFKGKEKYSS